MNFRLIGALLLLGSLVTILGIGAREHFELNGSFVETKEQPLEAYMNEEIEVLLNEDVIASISRNNTGITTINRRVEGSFFNRYEVFSVTDPNPYTSLDPEIKDLQDKEPTEPWITSTWDIIEGETGYTVNLEEISPDGWVYSTTILNPTPTTHLEAFIDLRETIQNNQIDLNSNGETLRWFDPEELAPPNITFNAETQEVIISEKIFETLDDKLNSFVQTATPPRYNYATNFDNTEPLIKDDKLVPELISPGEPGLTPDREQARLDFEKAILNGESSIEIILIEQKLDPTTASDMTIKLAEARTPDTGGSRMTNIRLLLELVNGTVVQPGECFCVNSIVGERTADKGFTVAGAIANGEHIESYGGGISQTATLFFQTSYMAGLDYPHRYEEAGIGGGHLQFGHSEYFARYDNYYTEGWTLNETMEQGILGYAVEDTINYPNREAGFINTTHHPIMVFTFDTGNEVGVSLWSKERTRFGVWEGTERATNGTCINWTHYRTIYNMDNEVIAEDSFNGYYRTAGPIC